jgi:ribosomal protein S18 acetylase RimI-like enzyme
VNAEEIIVRKATIKDIDGIINVLESTKLTEETWKGNEGWTKRALQKAISNRNCTILLAELDSTIVGFIDYIVFPSFWECAKHGMINHLFVHNAYQGKGFGAKLVRAVIERVDAEGIGELHVPTEWKNAKARRLYGKYGFTKEHLLLERSRGPK